MKRLLQTSSFRLTILYACLFALSGSVLFGLVSWSIGHASTQEVQRDADEEMDEVKSTAGSLDLATLQRVVTAYVAASPDTQYLLQDRSGRVLAGNLPAMAPRPGAILIHQSTKPNLIRGRARLLADGYLFVGVFDRQTPRMRSALVRAFVESLAATFALALAGGAFMSLNVLRRVEAIGRASRDIMAGDLDRRVTLTGSGDEFDQLGAGLNAMLDRIQALMAGLQQVSSDIAHDLRTPLTRMRQRLELALRRSSDPDALREALDRSIGDVDAILATFSALLRIAQIKAGTRRAGFAAVDLAEVLAQVQEAFAPVAEERGQTLIGLSAGLAPAFIRGDRELLTQMLANLIENAITHSPPGAHIAAGVIEGPAVVVEDDGPGIPEDQLEAVKARFYRLEASRTTPGSGLGLAMVTAIAALHEAELVLEAKAPGLRATVKFE